MAVRADGAMTGSVSGGCVEGAVVQEAQDILGGAPSHLIQFGVADEIAWEVGLACGGSIEVFVQPLDPDPGREQVEFNGEELEVFIDLLLPTPTIIMIGGVHISIALAEMARSLGYRTIVIDARKYFATQERFPAIDQLIQSWPEEGFEAAGIDASTAVVVLTHDPKIDDPALKLALRSPAFYVGALGSRTTHAKRIERLRQDGLSNEVLARLRAPVGLDLGARTPQEIALSVLAEITASRHGMLATTP
jgi:xanthine dehydrogenase accessory factor